MRTGLIWVDWWGNSRYDIGYLKGNFIIYDGGFNLSFDIDLGLGESLAFKMSARPGANITSETIIADFVNLGEIDTATMDDFEERLQMLVLRLVLGSLLL